MHDTEQFPELWAEVYERDDDLCSECGESEGEHDRCCSIGLDLYYANIDLQIGE